MKKVRFFSVFLVLALVLTGCGSSKKELSLGQLENGSYRNNYTGYGFDLGDDWIFHGAQELEGIDWDAMEGEISEQMEGRDQFTDFLAENPEALTTINLVYTAQSGAEQVGNRFLTDEERADSVLAQRPAIEEAYIQVGITVEDMEKVQVTFLGRPTWGVKTTAKVEDLDYYILQTFGNSADVFCTVLTCASFGEDRTEQLLKMFYEVT